MGIIYMGTVLEEIDKTVADSDNYEEGEPLTSPKAIDECKDLITSVTVPNLSFHVAPYFGELSVTWRNGTKMVRLMTYSEPSRKAQMYFHLWEHGPLPSGQIVEATAQALSDKLAWLMTSE